MGHFLDVAYRVLTEEGRPHTAEDIVSIGLDRGWLHSSGKTPWQTMKSKLSTDILRRKRRSRFMRTEPGIFGLREWKPSYREYHATRFEKALLDEQIVVFPAASLEKYVGGSGLHTVPLQNSAELISECHPMQRRHAERDYRFVQLVSVYLLRYGDEYLTYKRSRRLPEARLHGSYSMVFGGHLNPDDVLPLLDIFRPQVGAQLLVRELAEEVILPGEPPPPMIYKGLLYDDSQAISSQHLGIVYDVVLGSKDYEIGERGFLIDAKFETLDEIEARITEFENWSVMIAKHERGNRYRE
jgi:predicted NUDIX family phosphoesterase